MRELQAQLWEKDSLIHGLLAEVENLKQKLSRVKHYLEERGILENYFAWVRGRSQQKSMDDRER